MRGCIQSCMQRCGQAWLRTWLHVFCVACTACRAARLQAPGEPSLRATPGVLNPPLLHTNHLPFSHQLSMLTLDLLAAVFKGAPVRDVFLNVSSRAPRCPSPSPHLRLLVSAPPARPPAHPAGAATCRTGGSARIRACTSTGRVPRPACTCPPWVHAPPVTCPSHASPCMRPRSPRQYTPDILRNRFVKPNAMRSVAALTGDQINEGARRARTPGPVWAAAAA